MPAQNIQPKLYTPLAQRRFSGSTEPNADLDTIMKGIAHVESGGDYGAVGKPNKKGQRAYGKYQVFETNLPTWTQEALGKQLSKEEFLADPEAQETVAKHFLGQNLQKYGNADDVASVWFTGRPVAKAGLDVQDYTGTSNASYLSKFKEGMGQMIQKYIPLAQRGSRAQASALTQNPVIQQGRAASAEIGQKLYKPLLERLGRVQQPIVDTLTSPGSTYLTPELEKLGVPAGIAVGAGIAADIAAPGPSEFKGLANLSTKLIEKLKGKSTVSKQFISDLTNQADLKQPERDLIRKALEDEGDTIDVPSFANRVKSELLPLKGESTSNLPGGRNFNTQYESITLPDELRGPVANYDERIYSSPIKTSAGSVHFGRSSGVPADNYFAHTRIEDLPTSKKELQPGSDWHIYDQGIYSKEPTRRVIELQSDLFQKGRLEQESLQAYTTGAKAARAKAREAELSKLEPYRNTWHERVIREEVKQAAKDGKTKLQFPTGETAMKIEGLGESQAWFHPEGKAGEFIGDSVTPDSLKIGINIKDRDGADWIITDVLGDGKFKAVQKKYVDLGAKNWKYSIDNSEVAGGGNPAWMAENTVTGQRDFVSFTPANKDKALAHLKSKVDDKPLAELGERYGETFDISGKVDKENPIYKFYEKEVGRYLKNKYKAELITDPQGVQWWELTVPKEAGRAPIEAFGVAPFVLPEDEEN